jgi:hypothetical protein
MSTLGSHRVIVLVAAACAAAAHATIAGTLEQQNLDPVRVNHLLPGRPGEQGKAPVL